MGLFCMIQPGIIGRECLDIFLSATARAAIKGFDILLDMFSTDMSGFSVILDVCKRTAKVPCPISLPQ